MASNSRITQTILNDKKYDSTLYILWLGEFGHLLMNVLPRVNKLRLEYPQSKIVFAGYEEDMIYFRDNKGEWTVDEYWGIPWWPTDRGCHECKGQWPDYAIELKEWIDARVFDKNSPMSYNTKVIDTTTMTLAEWTAEFKKKPRIAYPLKNIVSEEPKLETYPHCIIYARAKNYSSTLFRSWHDDRWVKFIDLLLREYRGIICVCGVSAESVKFSWGSRVKNYTNINGLERSTKTLNLLSNADFCISDCSGSANFAIQVGIPTFVSGPDGYADGFERNKNYFGAHVLYQTCDRDSLTPEIRMDGWRQFMKNLHYNLERNIYEGVVQ